MEHLSKFAQGTVLRQNVSGPTYDCSKINKVPNVDSVVIENTNELVIFAVNRVASTQELQVDHDFHLSEDVEHIILKSNNLSDKNMRENPKLIHPTKMNYRIANSKQISIELEAHSWNVIIINKIT